MMAGMYDHFTTPIQQWFLDEILQDLRVRAEDARERLTTETSPQTPHWEPES
jgi:hypothetical protein